MYKISICFSLLPLFCYSQISVNKSDEYFYPSIHWQKMDMQKQSDWDNTKLESLKKFVKDSTSSTGLMVIYRGKAVFEFGDLQEISSVASCRKSILSMLYGSYITGGRINLSSTLKDLKADDIGGLLPIERQATIRDLLTSRSGVYHPASNFGDASDMAPLRGTIKPGTFWLYNNWDFNMAGYILEQKTGKSIYELIDSLLAKPLQFQDWNIKNQQKEGDTTKSKHKAYAIKLSTRDMARLGYLMLRQGKWMNKILIPSEWISTSTSVVTSYIEASKNNLAYMHFGYGYLWWVWDKPFDNEVFEGAYTASGVMGQFITIIPKIDLVVAHKTKMEYGRLVSSEMYLQILEKICNAYTEIK